MMNISQSYWIGDTYHDKVGFLKAKDCNFKKENLQKELENELMEKIELITEVQEGYFRVQRTEEFMVDEYGEYCYMPCNKGKGATLYYFAAYKTIN